MNDIPTIIRIASRKSPLALWQANFIKERLLKVHSKKNLQIEIIGLSTKGDEILDKSLSKIGGKGLFIKGIQSALINNQADIAVHSLKDMGVEEHDVLEIVAITERHNPYDALVSNQHECLSDFKTGSIIGTSSLRRICQLEKHYPYLVFKPLRGNIGTRLDKLDAGDFDGIILAAAGLQRMLLHDRIASILPDSICLPAIGQGALAVEARKDDVQMQLLLSPLVDSVTTQCIAAERGVNKILKGSCQTPIAAFATLCEDEQTLMLRALVGSPCGETVISETQQGHINDAEQLGLSVGNELVKKGARVILDQAKESE